jgi:hypothetical protein
MSVDENLYFRAIFTIAIYAMIANYVLA